MDQRDDIGGYDRKFGWGGFRRFRGYFSDNLYSARWVLNIINIYREPFSDVSYSNGIAEWRVQWSQPDIDGNGHGCKYLFMVGAGWYGCR